jgi:deoxyribonucleoside regulator
MEVHFNTSLMVKAAEMYYLRGMKQEEIARELNISRSTISVMLTAARESGIVEIVVHDPQLNHDLLSQKIQSKFNLTSCLVVPTALQNIDNLRKLVVLRARQYFNSILAPGMNIGVAWGRTCYEFIDLYVPENVQRDISVIPLIGGSSQTASHFQINEIVRRFAVKIQGKAFFIHAPAQTSSLEEKNLFIGSSMMQPILEKWANLDLIITSIGTPPSFDQNRRKQYIGEYEVFRNLTSEAAGDICTRYYDIDGCFLTDSVIERILSIPVQDLQAAGQVIAIASGIEKARAICGALRTGVIDTLVTDEQTAQAICQIIA